MKNIIGHINTISRCIYGKTIDAAPLNPTQEMNNFSFIEYLNGYNVINVATGLATRIINIEIDTDIPIMLMNFDGNDNRPNIKNKTICIIQEIQSKN